MEKYSFDLIVELSTHETAIAKTITGHSNPLIHFMESEIAFLAPETTDTTALYDDSYFDAYVGYEASPIAEDLNNFRIEFTNDIIRKYCTPNTSPVDVTDIGAGAGTFVKAYDCMGYDVMPKSIANLKSMDKWNDVYESGTRVATFWDSLEHIVDPIDVLQSVLECAIISSPCYKNSTESIVLSKHFKPNEHVWYWTTDGLKTFMKFYGFECVEESDGESKCGREKIMTHAFIKK